MAGRAVSHAAWWDVDSTDDPDFFVRFLDASRARLVETARADPAGYFAYFDVKPGHRVLDAACGLGELTQVLAGLVSPGGEALGVDFSAVMVLEAQRRASGDGLPVRFEQGDIMALNLPDGRFDRTRAEQVLQHVSDPEKALRELVRVTRPGGLIAVLEPDWDTLVIDADSLSMSRAFTAYNSSVVVRHGAIGRRLPVLFRDAGLLDVTTTPTVITAPYLVLQDFIESNTRRAVEEGVMRDEDARDWLRDLQSRHTAGRFFSAFTYFRVTGRLPE